MNLHYFITFSSRGSGVCRSLFLRTFMVMILFITGSNGIYAGEDLKATLSDPASHGSEKVGINEERTIGINAERTITVDNKERRYWLYVPASVEGTKNVPVVFSLHGRYGNDDPNNQKDILTKDGKPIFTSLADKEGFIVVYPQGRNGGDEKDKAAYPGEWYKAFGMVRAGKPLEKRMQIQSLSRKLWMR